VPKNDAGVPLGIFDSGLTVSGTRVGAFVTLAIVLVALIGIPLARPFLLGTVGVGLIVGLALWWRHSQRPGGGIGSGDSNHFERLVSPASGGSGAAYVAVLGSQSPHR
jgi:hypothetical protein